MSDNQPDAPKPDSPKPTLRMRKDDAPPAFQPVETPDRPAPVISHYKPVKPASSAFNILPLLAPLLVTAAIGGLAYFGYTKVSEQNARITQAQTAATEAEAARESTRRMLSDKESAGREVERACAATERDIESEKVKAVNEAPGRAEAELRPKIDEVIRKIDAAKNGMAEADRTAESQAREAVYTAQRQVAELEPKVAELERQVADLKTWLNANNKTLHPKF